MTQEINTVTTHTSPRKEVDAFFKGALNVEERKYTTEVIADIAKAKLDDGEPFDMNDLDDVIDQVVEGLKLNHGKWSDGGHKVHFDEIKSPRYAGLVEWVKKQVDSQILFNEKTEQKKITTPMKLRNTKEMVKKAADQEAKKSNSQRNHGAGKKHPGRPKLEKNDPEQEQPMQS